MTAGTTLLTSALYTPGVVPSDPESLNVFLTLELRKIAQSITKLANMSPQVASQEPTRPQPGWIRYAVAPWNPLGVPTGNSGWVQFINGSWQVFTP